VNRIALHQSAVHPLDPVRVVAIAQEAGLDSIGVRVEAGPASDDVRAWWAKGIGSPMLADLVAALLAARVTVLDVGRVELGAGLEVLDGREPYMRVLEIGVRLGAQFVTSRAPEGGLGQARERFALLAELAARFGLRPLVTSVAGTAIASVEDAVAVVEGTAGGVVLDVPAAAGFTPDELDVRIVGLGEVLGYVRVPAHDLETGALAPGLLATLPPQIPVAIGGEMPGGHAGDVDTDHVRRVRDLRTAVDALLRHPRAAADR
jgi:hypothetical protein